MDNPALRADTLATIRRIAAAADGNARGLLVYIGLPDNLLEQYDREDRARAANAVCARFVALQGAEPSEVSLMDALREAAMQGLSAWPRAWRQPDPESSIWPQDERDLHVYAAHNRGTPYAPGLTLGVLGLAELAADPNPRPGFEWEEGCAQGLD